ncbi:MAG: VWA domain-containing protein [Chloroflexi bacterium]|nr:VWA domain-containing protein [Chloroflexota bacterium]
MRERLEEVKALEREGIAQRLQKAEEQLRQLHQKSLEKSLEADLLLRLQELAKKNLQFVDGLSPDPVATIQQLKEYEFMDQQAQQNFDQLLKSLQQQMVRSYLQGLPQQLHSLSPEALQATKEMLQELNKLLEERISGGQPNFQAFMRKYDSFFGDDPPTSLDQLVERIQKQAALLESMLNSLPAAERRHLQKALESAFREPGLSEELARLAVNLEHLHSLSAWRREYTFLGPEALDFDTAWPVMEQLQKIDDLERQIKRLQHGLSVTDMDPELFERVLGKEALHEFEQLRGLTSILEDAGYIHRIGNRLELTPKGMRKIGQKALREIFTYIKRDRGGHHTSPHRGAGLEQADGTKRYEFGQPFNVDLHKTLFNALLRDDSGPPLRLRPEDFEVYQTEQRHHSSTALMLDLSLSMAMRGNFLAAKKVALALDNLVRTQFPRDTFYIIGFSTYAREVKPENLPYLSWDEFDPYTNIQHGLRLSRKLLSRGPGGSRQIIIISDGEPTAHLEGGQLFLQYPPSPRTIRETLREVKRCTSTGITINTFMLDRNSHLMEFVDQMTRINRGRVFYTSPDRLGQYVLVDYFNSRRRLLSS